MSAAAVIGQNFQKAFKNLETECRQAYDAAGRLWKQVPQEQWEQYTDIQRVCSAALKIFGIICLYSSAAGLIRATTNPSRALSFLITAVLNFVFGHDLLVMGTNGFEKHVKKPGQTAAKAVARGVVETVKERGLWNTGATLLFGTEREVQDLGHEVEESANRQHTLDLVENTLVMKPIVQFIFGLTPKA